MGVGEIPRVLTGDYLAASKVHLQATYIHISKKKATGANSFHEKDLVLFFNGLVNTIILVKIK